MFHSENIKRIQNQTSFVMNIQNQLKQKQRDRGKYSMEFIGWDHISHWFEHCYFTKVNILSHSENFQRIQSESNKK